MALTPCKECGTPMSTDAKTCPKCGKPNIGAGQKVLNGCGVAVAALFIIPLVVIVIGVALKPSQDAAEWQAMTPEQKQVESERVKAQQERVAVVKEGEAMMQSARIKIRSMMKDPDSAKFKNVRVHAGPKNLKIVCGEVNAKNSFGAMTGFDSFMFTDNGLEFQSKAKSEKAFIDIWNISCVKWPKIAADW